MWIRLVSSVRSITWRTFVWVGIVLVLVCIVALRITAHDAERTYEALLSAVMSDRHGTPISIAQNTRGHYALPLRSLPPDFATLLVKKEDRYFYFHPGVNPFSTVRALSAALRGEYHGGASTITQQFAKNVLGTENERTVWNKIREGWYALALEVFYTKDEILVRYANTVFLGNQVQGFGAASHAYFGKDIANTTVNERLSLLATLSHPSTRNPWKTEENTAHAAALASRLNTSHAYVTPNITTSYAFRDDASFELESANIGCEHSCITTIDAAMTRDLRAILARRIDAEWDRGARNGAIVVIDPDTEEVLAMVGSRDPFRSEGTSEINMSIEPRPIGSTIKPFLYLEGFARGLRPYTLVDDREYKYPIATGFPLYPKNYDGRYHGMITLHYALANSLNVPSVKVLEYIGLDAFYSFLTNTLRFKPIQDLDQYQYGIALGGLEMDLLTLTHYFTLFPRGGTLTPLSVMLDGAAPILPLQSNISEMVRVADEAHTELVHAILSDRLTGVEQFGLSSTLNIPATEYGVKTGTSRDFHDSWVVGYTPDFVVGVWLGNAENKPLDQISGQSGAGAIWNEVMSYLLASSYASENTLSTEHIVRIPFNDSDEWGLPDDDSANIRTALTSDTLILQPHTDDLFELSLHTIVPLRARESSLWSVNGREIGVATSTSFAPTYAGRYEITATSERTGRREIIMVTVTTPR